MRSLLLAASALLLATALPGSAQQASFGHVTTVQMPRGHMARTVLIEDVDGDGARDLVIAASRGGKRARRMLRIHVRRPGDVAFGSEPDMVFDLLPDVVAVAVADVHADPGAEIVLLTQNGVFALRPRAESERDRYVRLVTAEVLWQLPEKRDVLDWQAGVRDVDGDGLVDLIVPEPDGYTVAVQKRAGDDARSFESYGLRLPSAGVDTPQGRASRRQEGRARRRQMEVSLRLGDEAESDGSGLLSVSESVPAPQLLDWDGDRRIDVLAQTTEELLVWTQGVGGAFPTLPDVRVPLPLEVDRRRLLDVSFSAHTSDLDGDGRADYVLVAGDQNAEDARAQVAVYGRAPSGKATGRPLFGEKGLPRQLLIVAGIAGAPELHDVDGDALPDLIIGAARLDALDTVRAIAGGALDVDLYVYLNQGGTFSKRPDLTRTLSVAASGLRRARRSLAADFVADATGDGVRELLVRDDPERVRLHMVRRTSKGLQVIDRPLWETAVEEKADLVVTDGSGGPPELVLFTRGTVQHVRFGR